MNKNVVIIGAGGHAKVIADIIVKSKDNVIGFLDDNVEIGKAIIGNLECIGKISKCVEIQATNPNYMFVIAIGNNFVRKNIYEKYKLNYYIAIHPTAIIGMQVTIEEGAVVMANACINPNAKIGKSCIINTGAIIEHDNIIEDYVHISPNSTLCGTVKIAECTHIGAGSTIKNNITICENCIIGAGAVVVKDIKEKGTYVGVPARLKETNYEKSIEN